MMHTEDVLRYADEQGIADAKKSFFIESLSLGAIA